jgi:hypothetical protein
VGCCCAGCWPRRRSPLPFLRARAAGERRPARSRTHAVSSRHTRVPQGDGRTWEIPHPVLPTTRSRVARRDARARFHWKRARPLLRFQKAVDPPHPGLHHPGLREGREARVTRTRVAACASRVPLGWADTNPQTLPPAEESSQQATHLQVNRQVDVVLPLGPEHVGVAGRHGGLRRCAGCGRWVWGVRAD